DLIGKKRQCLPSLVSALRSYVHIPLKLCLDPLSEEQTVDSSVRRKITENRVAVHIGMVSSWKELCEDRSSSTS
ncbi:MAG: hypothetical protein ACRD3J_08985, partial [Thermoanaerobaculia bacterium]